MLNERVEPVIGLFDLAKAGADAVANVRPQPIFLRSRIVRLRNTYRYSTNPYDRPRMTIGSVLTSTLTESGFCSIAHGTIHLPTSRGLFRWLFLARPSYQLLPNLAVSRWTDNIFDDCVRVLLGPKISYIELGALEITGLDASRTIPRVPSHLP